MKKYLSYFLAFVMVCTLIPMGSVTASAKTLKGDGNGDGVVSALDARIALQYAVNPSIVTDEILDVMDMDGNAKITAIDARIILSKAVEEEDSGNTSMPNQILAAFGYEYDATQDIYYTAMNPWQRNFGFTDLYDDMAAYATMFYQTLKIDFEYGDLLWRLQWWKGQYGVLEGAELGVYTKDPANADSPFYKCAEAHNLLEMSFEYYHNTKEFDNNQPLFTRPEQEHWWITGFKFGVCSPSENVVKATLIARDKTMADGIEKGLKNVTDKYGKINGFTKYNPKGSDNDNVYEITEMGDGRYKFTIIWRNAGYLNYGNPENPES